MIRPFNGGDDPDRNPGLSQNRRCAACPLPTMSDRPNACPHVETTAITRFLSPCHRSGVNATAFLNVQLANYIWKCPRSPIAALSAHQEAKCAFTSSLVSLSMRGALAPCWRS
jgi:hypothetical protein